MIFIVITALLLAAALLSYQIHRRRTPFFVNVSNNGDSIEISIFRRGFKRWPKSARKDLGLSANGATPNYWMTVKTISIHDNDADEKMLEAVVNCKAVIDKWKEDREKTSNLEIQARKALRR